MGDQADSRSAGNQRTPKGFLTDADRGHHSYAGNDYAPFHCISIRRWFFEVETGCATGMRWIGPRVSVGGLDPRGPNLGM
jgi:hypothetical protein